MLVLVALHSRAYYASERDASLGLAAMLLIDVVLPTLAFTGAIVCVQIAHLVHGMTYLEGARGTAPARLAPRSLLRNVQEVLGPSAADLSLWLLVPRYDGARSPRARKKSL